MVKHLGIILLATCILSGCAVGKFVPDDQILVIQQKVELQSTQTSGHSKRLEKSLAFQLKYKPNYGIGKIGLWLYYKTENTKTKGIKNWINKKFAKPPIYFQPQILVRNQAIIENQLLEHGYFDHQLSLDTNIVATKMDIRYDIHTPGRYVINNLYYPSDSLPFADLYQAASKSPPITKGQYYSKQRIDNERNRLYDKLADLGYLDFDKNALVFYLDTTRSDRTTDIYIEVQNIADSTSMSQYRIGETYVIPDYDLDESDSLLLKKDTIKFSQLNIIQSKTVVHPKTLARTITQQKGAIVNNQSNNLTLSKFQHLGIFKFTNVNLDKRIIGDSAYLDRYFYLTPSLNQQIIGEFEINNRTGDFFGSAFSFSYLHRNIFKGAELFEVGISTGIETQIGRANSFTNTFDIQGNIGLTIPYFVLPFRFSVNHIGNARTSIKMGNNFQIRKDFFTLTAFNTSWSYEWKANRFASFSATPLNINLVKLINTTQAFEDILAENIRLQSNFQNTLIFGSDFSFVYNNQTVGTRSPYIFASAKISTSGNLVSLFNSSLSLNEEGNRKLLGTNYAQYVKLVPEIRYYIPRDNGLIATRLGFGVGIPFGNSNTLPYIEQFFVGGSNSIRAFRIRQLGPGGFIAEDIDKQVGFFDQTGDVKIELNMDYRFDLIGFLKGAFFVDAANVWTLKNDFRSEGLFKFNQFYKEIAIGTGVGLRLDFDFFVVRLDGSFAIRKPTASGFKWTVSDINLFDKNWRSDNLVWNLALGYPF